MKIGLTGGGTGGHSYPLIAIAEQLTSIIDEEKLQNVRLYYFSDKPFAEEVMKKHTITFIPVSTGKMRVYASAKNIFDGVKTFFGIFSTFWKVFRVYPDVIVSKGGYVSFPVLVAAWILGIPTIVHESDTVPGRVNVWAAKKAVRVAINFPEAADYFPKEKVSLTGQPIRRSITFPVQSGGREYFGLSQLVPTIGVWGGSQGAQTINTLLVELLPELLPEYQVIHQTGDATFEQTTRDANILLEENEYKGRYVPLANLNDEQLKFFAGAVDIIISRSGSSVFEIAAWGKPSILIPYPIAHGDHQKKNAYYFARAGAATVLEEKNLTASILKNEIETLFSNKELSAQMSKKVHELYSPDAGKVIATEAISLALRHA
jgi:UDP-N-acetylglucosamine--N-acetylmuramyl-(pentapeptide) pyrophosphoryl-undecaprenol N-acetylglucosamine transferase